MTPSDEETKSFLRHIHKLDDNDGFEIDVEPEMLEQIISPDEVGTREHKLAMLPGNCVNLKVALDNEHELIALDGSYDASYFVAPPRRLTARTG